MENTHPNPKKRALIVVACVATLVLVLLVPEAIPAVGVALTVGKVLSAIV